MENYLYFAAADINTGGSQTAREGIMVPASKYIGADPVSATTTKFMFESLEGLDEGSTNIVLTHGSANNKKVIRAFMAAMNANPSTGFVVMADSDVAGSSKSSEYVANFEGDVTTVAITETKTSSVLSATHGAGAIDDTESYPQTRRWIENGIIITEIKVDLTGLTGHGSTANDVIGVKTAAPDAYLYQQAVATNGVIFKTEMICLELPAGNSNVDINLVWASGSTLGYTDAGGTTYGINGGTWVAGTTLQTLTANGTDAHYMYLTEGGTDGDDSAFTAGQFIIRLYGHPLLS